MRAHILPSTSTRSVEDIARWPKGLFSGLSFPWSYNASGLVVRPDVVIFWGRDGLASSHLILMVVAEWVDSACERETYCEFAWRVKVTLPCVVALATCCSTHSPSTTDLSCGVGWAGGITILSNSYLMVWMGWLVSSTIPFSWACWLIT